MSKDDYCIMSLQGCVEVVVQKSFLSSAITPRVSLLTLSNSVLVLVADTPNFAHVGHYLQTGLQLFKMKYFEKPVTYPQNSSHVPLGVRIPQVENPCFRQSVRGGELMRQKAYYTMILA